MNSEAAARTVPVPRIRDGISPAWVTAALTGRHPGAVVSGVEVADVDPGTTTRARLNVEYSSGDGPASVFVKLQGRLDHRLFLGALGILYREARISEASLLVDLPLVYATGIDRRRLQSVVVFEDLLLRGAEPNDATRPLKPELVANGLEGLASLHAEFWNISPATHPSLAWLPTWRFTPGWRLTSAAGTLSALRSNAAVTDLVPPRLRNWRHLTRLWARSVAAARLGPLTLLHGDPHVGNTYLLPGGTLGFLDWQLTRRGSWAHDVGYFLVSSLDIVDRRAHEHDLLAHYLDTLRSHGVDAPPADEAWLRYRRTPAYGLPAWVTTAGLGDYQRPDIALETIRRFATAFNDLETEDALAAPDRP